jgi:hypothetical protein
MSAIDNEILTMFNTLNPTRQGQLLDVLGQLLEEQHAEHDADQNEQKPADEPAAS